MFHIQVAQKDLAFALSAVSSTVGKNSQNLGDDCVSITDLGTNTIEVYTTNGIEFSKVNVILAMGCAGSIERMPYVNFKRFKAMIDSISENEYVSIKANVNDIEITYGTRQKPLKLTGSVNGMIPLPTCNGSSMTIDRNIIETAIKKACTIIKDDSANPIQSCIRIYTDRFNVEITAVDVKNNRMFLHKSLSSDSNNTNSVLLEANKFNKALNGFTNFKDIEFEFDNNIVVATGKDSSGSMISEFSYYSRTIAGNYPTNISKMFDNVTEYAVVNKDELKSSLIRINAIEDTSSNNDTMNININSNRIDIVKTSQYGVVEDSISLENEISSPINDTFKAKPFADILKNFTDNGSYGSPNTFEIGKNNNGKNNYYILKETGKDTNMFLVTGFVQSSSSNP
jgi:hypothetical protein